MIQIDKKIIFLALFFIFFISTNCVGQTHFAKKKIGDAEHLITNVGSSTNFLEKIGEEMVKTMLKGDPPPPCPPIDTVRSSIMTGDFVSALTGEFQTTSRVSDVYSSQVRFSKNDPYSTAIFTAKLMDIYSCDNQVSILPEICCCKKLLYETLSNLAIEYIVEYYPPTTTESLLVGYEGSLTVGADEEVFGLSTENTYEDFSSQVRLIKNADQGYVIIEVAVKRIQ
ncbi:MAG: hypothetical protein GXO74_09135 [Calditrichaeota bacterium]|nr:hypothetical protein [Calditrichota bacterium]